MENALSLEYSRGSVGAGAHTDRSQEVTGGVSDLGSRLRVSEIRDPDDFLALRHEWNKLVERDGRATFFQTWEFQYHTWRIFAKALDLNLVVVRDELGELVGCAPFATQRWRAGPFSARVLRFCSLKYCDYNDVMAHTERAREVVPAVARWLGDNLQRWDVVDLGPVREESWVTDPDLFLARAGHRFRVTRRTTAPYLGFKASWTTYEDALTSRRAQRMRNKTRKLFRRFPGAFSAAADGEELRRAVDEFFELHQLRMQEQHQRGHFADGAAREAFRVLIGELGKRGIARVHTLGSRQRTIAALVSFEFRGTVSYFLSGFDPEYAALSPGQVIHALRITEAMERGASEYDFLCGDEPYKYFWTGSERALCTIEFFTGSWRRPWYWIWSKLRRWLSRAEAARAAYARLRSARSTEVGGANRPVG